MNLVDVQQLTKDFVIRKGPLFRRKRELFQALKGISFTIPRGSIFGLLGPNGAGKSTIIKVLATLLLPTSGRVRICGFDAIKEDREVRRRIGAVLPGERTLFWKLTVRENLRYFGSLYGLGPKHIDQKCRYLLAYFDLEEQQDLLVEKLSTGLRQRVVLCRALLSDPAVILLDEPTLGLDPQAARNLRRMIKRIKEEGKAILLTTHYLFEADELSDTVGIINKGRIIALDSPQRLKAGLGRKKTVRPIKADEPTLEDVFIALTGESLRGNHAPLV